MNDVLALVDRRKCKLSVNFFFKKTGELVCVLSSPAAAADWMRFDRRSAEKRRRGTKGEREREKRTDGRALHTHGN